MISGLVRPVLQSLRGQLASIRSNPLQFELMHTPLSSLIPSLMPKRLKRVGIWFALLCTAWTTTALAQPLIEEQQRLNFGTLAIASNASVSRLTYPRSGNGITIDGQFVLIARGTPGLYRFSGFPAYTPLGVSLNTTTLTAGSNGTVEPLSVDSYNFTEITTNALGEAELSLGASIETTGTGTSYVDAIYSGAAVLRVDYWQPEVKEYVANTKIVDMETELRSTLTFDEEQQLSFGTLFARSSSTAQAAMTLSPSGTYTISEPDDSRLVSLDRPELGIFRVSGAASNHTLTITLQATPVLLEHTENPASAPHLILSDLIALPDGTGTTDANGELQIALGGTLKTELTASPEIYPSGQYEGIYQLTVSY